MIQKNGLILLNKPGGITSFRVLNSIKKTLCTNKIGHTGTLDKFASGLLVVLTGKATKLSSLVTGLDKQYSGIIRFGIETDTLDTEGTVTAQGPVPSFKVIETSLPNFVGKIKQKPPAYSAIHINGERSYARARKGETMDLPEREIEIYSFKLLSWEPPDLSFSIHCSKGTYIRSVARDLALSCNSRGYLIKLERTSVGPFKIQESVNPENFILSRDLLTLEEFITRLPNLSKLTIKDSNQTKILHGAPLEDSFFLNPPPKDNCIAAILAETGVFLALAEKKEQSYNYIFVASEGI